MAKKQTKVEKVAQGQYYETKDTQLVLVTNGRLKDDGELGRSFEGKSVTVNAKTGKLVQARSNDRFYIDELVRKLTKRDLEEWIAVEQREAEALAAGEAEQRAKQPDKQQAAKKAAMKKAGKKAAGKMSQLDAAVKVLSEADEALNTKAMVESMQAKG